MFYWEGKLFAYATKLTKVKEAYKKVVNDVKKDNKALQDTNKELNKQISQLQDENSILIQWRDRFANFFKIAFLYNQIRLFKN